MAITTNIVDPSQNHVSPYYIHLYDNQSMELVSLKFDERNYGDRKRSMLISFPAKNKTGFIDGIIVKPNSIDEIIRLEIDVTT